MSKLETVCREVQKTTYFHFFSLNTVIDPVKEAGIAVTGESMNELAGL
jgi:hypothetical protein